MNPNIKIIVFPLIDLITSGGNYAVMHRMLTFMTIFITKDLDIICKHLFNFVELHLSRDDISNIIIRVKTLHQTCNKHQNTNSYVTLNSLYFS